MNEGKTTKYLNELKMNDITNPIPMNRRFARVVPVEIVRGLQHEQSRLLGRPYQRGGVFVTAADDIADVIDAYSLARRLTLIDETGNLLQGPFGIVEFTLHSLRGLASPVFRMDPGFVGFGRTAGGAREFVIRNRRVRMSRNINLRILN
jgi:hypothetical protein